MWATALAKFASQYCVHSDPPPHELSRILLTLSKEDAPHMIQRVLAKLNVHRHFVFTNGRPLAVEFVSMLLRKGRFSFLYYISTGPFAHYVNNKTRDACFMGLLNHKHWTKALHLYETAKGTRSIPIGFNDFFPKPFVQEIVASQRIHSLKALVQSDETSKPALSPLACYALFRSVISTCSWEKAFRVLGKYQTPRINGDMIVEDPRVIKAMSAKFSGATWQQWYGVIGKTLTTDAWSEIRYVSPLLPLAIFQSGQWKQAIRNMQTPHNRGEQEYYSASVRAAVLAGNWKLVFRLRDVTQVIANFDELPASITIPLISVFGLRWHYNGRRLCEKLKNNVFLPIEERAKNSVYLYRLLRLEESECFLEDEEVSLFRMANAKVGRDHINREGHYGELWRQVRRISLETFPLEIGEHVNINRVTHTHACVLFQNFMYAR
ncbi:hypothetical protein XU18_3007 [Perkinsela sp. CCAP 1560/4]|nr:hypothetical protein XU18_3007 [Perkinsela sp. CCAP 1560/4]|eukprot:KNH06070.1 hypothetical protein XU18_3007 [Perkinsela sp. CCAP 1560/4]